MKSKIINYSKNITCYFKQSLTDAERACPEDKDLLPLLGSDKNTKKSECYMAIGHQVWLSGWLPPAQTKTIFDKSESNRRESLVEVELIIYPRVDLSCYRGVALGSHNDRILLPLVIFARLDRDGQLRPAAKSPWIPRKWLAPNESRISPIADIVEVNSFMTHHPFEGIETWNELVNYCTHMLCSVTGEAYTPPDNQKPGTSLFELNLLPGYELSKQSLLQIKDLPVVGAKGKMLKVLDILAKMDKLPPLYHSFISRDSPRLKEYQDLDFDSSIARQHVGQMSGEFPLSAKQRNALHHFLKQENGEMLAVNGPPGTGKTTLLRSVVANLWTQAALDEGDPPLIVAASNNNQAVTNILESFARVDEAGLAEQIKGRWLPEVESYGLYCCASSKANDNNPYLYLDPNEKIGPIPSWQTREYFERALLHFIQCSQHWLNHAETDLAEVKKALHKSMVQRRDQMVSGLNCLESFQTVEKEIVSRHGGVHTLYTQIETKREQYSKAKVEHDKHKSHLDEIYAMWERRNLLIRLLMWLPVIGLPFRKQEYRRTARLLNQWDLAFDDRSDAAVEGWFQTSLHHCRQTLYSLQEKIAELQMLIDRYRRHKNELDKWINHHRPKTLFSKTPFEQVNEINDRVIRFELFKLATHYWEAQWLLELDEFLKNKYTNKKSPANVVRKLRRFAKLTPCFVSTFYMTPSTFIAGEFKDNVWMDLPLFNEIDLLIVDEAGQALPEASAASFSLAKRALIVGDTDQIEPVWSVPSSVDRANLMLYNLLKDEKSYSYEDFWLKSGLLASSGNLMRIAQRQCHYHQFQKLQRGLYLTEHRRCYNDIIDYCNELVYQGVLEPQRGHPKIQVPWRTLSMVPVDEPSRSYGGSRGNPGEAKKIADWLSVERENILGYARQVNPLLAEKSDDEVLKASVGIVTPFSKQAALIRSELYSQGIHGLTVGTVHSLQGDERLLVLFSSVYGAMDESTGKFYDKGHNMLNVAVSRAKDSFIVFGHPDIFGVNDRSSPSGMLRQRLLVSDAIVPDTD